MNQEDIIPTVRPSAPQVPGQPQLPSITGVPAGAAPARSAASLYCACEYRSAIDVPPVSRLDKTRAIEGEYQA